MISLLQRLLDPAYLYALNLGPLGRWGPVYLLWGVALLLGLAAALWWLWGSGAAWGCRDYSAQNQHSYRGRGIPRPRSDVPPTQTSGYSGTAAKATALSCGTGLLTVALRLAAPYLTRIEIVRGLSPGARYMLIEVWTARVWPLSATLVALFAPLLHLVARCRLPSLVQSHADVLLGVPPDEGKLASWQIAFLACLHLAGLAWLWHSADRSLWWALPSLLVLSVLPLLIRPRRLRMETLGPMFFAYLSAVIYWFLTRWLRIDVNEYQAFSLPDPWSPWFNVPVVVTASVALTLLIQLRLIVRGYGSALPLEQKGDSGLAVQEYALPIGLALLTAAWLAATTIAHRTHGVTASDPYCYVQMAIDLAERGTAVHEFPLAGLARDLGLPTWPAVHIGYHPPGLTDRAPTMWSIGWPLLMVPLYWLGGPNALYWAAPLASLLALVATWCLVNETLRDRSPGVRWTVTALTCALVATSPEGSERILVPMADAAAQLFTVLTLWLLLRGQRAHRASYGALYGALAGACFGAAYFVRHPQLPLGVAAMAAAILSFGSSLRQERESATRAERSWIRGGVLLLAFALAALLVALPDLAYHRTAYGGWLNSESSEWFLLLARNVGSSFFDILQQGLLRREEIGYLAPFALYGGWLLWSRYRRAAWILFSGTLAVFLFHLFYAALRPRDLIAILPVLYFCAAYGLIALWRWAQGRRTVLAALLLIVCTTLLFARSYRTLALPWREDVITFGHVRAGQLDEFHRLRELTPENAVVGSMLNSGAIELHAGRAAVHPMPWTEQELHRWVEGLLARGRPFYILDDGEEMPEVLKRLEGRYRMQPIATLGLPYFAIGGGNLPRSARLYRIEKP